MFSALDDTGTVDEASAASPMEMEEISYIIGDEDHTLCWEYFLGAAYDIAGMEVITELEVGDEGGGKSGVGADNDGFSSLSLIFPDTFITYCLNPLLGYVKFDD